MPNASTAQSPRVLWDLVACGRDGDAPFRLVLYYTHGTIIEYFYDVATAVRAIETAETCTAKDVVTPDRTMTTIPDEANLVRLFVSEETFAGATRH